MSLQRLPLSKKRRLCMNQTRHHIASRYLDAHRHTIWLSKFKKDLSIAKYAHPSYSLICNYRHKSKMSLSKIEQLRGLSCYQMAEMYNFQINVVQQHNMNRTKIVQMKTLATAPKQKHHNVKKTLNILYSMKSMFNLSYFRVIP